jgi:hypothetical protein
MVSTSIIGMKILRIMTRITLKPLVPATIRNYTLNDTSVALMAAGTRPAILVAKLNHWKPFQLELEGQRIGVTASRVGGKSRPPDSLAAKRKIQNF